MCYDAILHGQAPTNNRECAVLLITGLPPASGGRPVIRSTAHSLSLYIYVQQNFPRKFTYESIWHVSLLEMMWCCWNSSVQEQPVAWDVKWVAVDSPNPVFTQFRYQLTREATTGQSSMFICIMPGILLRRSTLLIKKRYIKWLYNWI